MAFHVTYFAPVAE